MKARRTDLLSALDLPCRIAVKSKQLAMLHLEARDSVLHISTTDGDQSVVSRCQCEGELPSLFVRGSTIQSAVDFGAEFIELTFDTELHYVSGRRKLKIPHVIEGQLVELAKATPTVVPVTELADAIDTVVGFAATAVHRELLQSVHLKGNSRILLVESADGATLATIAQPAICGDFECIVPDEFAPTLSGALRLTGAELMLSDSTVAVRHSLGCYQCKLKEGVYTDYEAMLSKSKRAPIGIISRDEWVSSLRAVKTQLGDKDELARLRIEFDDKLATLLLRNETEFHDEIEGNFDPSILHVNARSFIKCLEVFKAESNINLNLVDPQGQNAIELKDQFLSVFTTQLRSE